jgi:hypothetical protein
VFIDGSVETGKKPAVQKVPQSIVHPGIGTVHAPSWNSNSFLKRFLETGMNKPNGTGKPGWGCAHCMDASLQLQRRQGEGKCAS